MFSFKAKHIIQCRKFWLWSERIKMFPGMSTLQRLSRTCLIHLCDLNKYEAQSTMQLHRSLEQWKYARLTRQNFLTVSLPRYNFTSSVWQPRKKTPTSSRSFLVLSSSALISSIVIPNQLSVQQKTCLWKFVKILLSAFENKSNTRKLEWSSWKGTELWYAGRNYDI